MKGFSRIRYEAWKCNKCDNVYLNADEAEDCCPPSSSSGVIDEIDQLRAHCEHCGGDYMATGIETGCPCQLKAKLAAAKERERVLLFERDAAIEVIRKNFGYDGVEQTLKKARAALAQRLFCI